MARRRRARSPGRTVLRAQPRSVRRCCPARSSLDPPPLPPEVRAVPRPTRPTTRARGDRADRGDGADRGRPAGRPGVRGRRPPAVAEPRADGGHRRHPAADAPGRAGRRGRPGRRRLRARRRRRHRARPGAWCRCSAAQRPAAGSARSRCRGCTCVGIAASACSARCSPPSSRPASPRARTSSPCWPGGAATGAVAALAAARAGAARCSASPVAAYGASGDVNGEFFIAGAAIVAVLGMILLVPGRARAGLAALVAGCRSRCGTPRATPPGTARAPCPAVAAVAATVAGVVALGIATGQRRGPERGDLHAVARRRRRRRHRAGGRLAGVRSASCEREVPGATVDAVLGRARTRTTASTTSIVRRPGPPRALLDSYGSAFGSDLLVSDGALPAGLPGSPADVAAARRAGAARRGSSRSPTRATEAGRGPVRPGTTPTRPRPTAEPVRARLPAVVVPIEPAGAGPQAVCPREAAERLGTAVATGRPGRRRAPRSPRRRSRTSPRRSPAVDARPRRSTSSAATRPTTRRVIIQLVLAGLGAVLMLGGTLTATFLALSDARPDLATLSAVGRRAADPARCRGGVRRRRGAGRRAAGGRWSASSRASRSPTRSPSMDGALLVAGRRLVLGVGVPTGPFLDVPWLMILGLVVVLPLLTALRGRLLPPVPLAERDSPTWVARPGSQTSRTIQPSNKKSGLTVCWCGRHAGRVTTSAGGAEHARAAGGAHPGDAGAAAGGDRRLPGRAGLRGTSTTLVSERAGRQPRRPAAPLPDQERPRRRGRRAPDRGARRRARGGRGRGCRPGRGGPAPCCEMLGDHFTSPVFTAALELWVAARTDETLLAAVAPLEQRVGRETHRLTVELLGADESRPGVRELVQATLDLVRGLGLADTISDDARRRGRILDQWARTLDAALGRREAADDACSTTCSPTSTPRATSSGTPSPASTRTAGRRRPRPPAGTSPTQIAHLLWTDEVAVAARHRQGGVGRVVAAGDRRPRRASSTPAAHEVARLAAAGAPRPLGRRPRRPSRHALRDFPEGQKMPWFGPPMSPASMATARFMETWAHGARRARRARRRARAAPTGSGTSPTSASAPATSRSPSTSSTPPAEEFRVELTAPSRRDAGRGAPRTPPRRSPARRTTSACWSPSASTATTPTWSPTARTPSSWLGDRPGLRRPARRGAGAAMSVRRDRAADRQLLRLLRRPALRDARDARGRRTALDVLTGDYLAELTMLILGKDTMKDPSLGYARTFVRQVEDCLGLALERGVRIVSNAGGLNPAGLADQAARGRARASASTPRSPTSRATTCGTAPPSSASTGALTANAYLGGFGIAAALAARRRRRRHRPGHRRLARGRAGGRRTSAGPPTSYDELAGAVVAGHVLECGTQATGGNFSGFRVAAARPARPLGFPLAEIAADGSLRRSPSTTAPAARSRSTPSPPSSSTRSSRPATSAPTSPPTSTRSRSRQAGTDRVAISGVRGEAPPEQLKVCVNELGGFRNTVEFVLTGLDIEAKADWVRAQMTAALAARPPTVTLVAHRAARTPTPTPRRPRPACSGARSRTRRPTRSARRSPRAAVELALASYPGFTMTAPPARRRRTASTGRSTSTAAGRAHRRARRRPARGRSPDPTGLRTAATDAGRRPSPYPAPPDVADPPDAARHVRARALRRQGRRRQPRALGRPRRLATSTTPGSPGSSKLITPRRVRELVPEAAGLDVEVYLLPNLRRGQRRHPRAARRGRRRVDPVRPAGQGARRVGAVADGRASRRRCVIERRRARGAARDRARVRAPRGRAAPAGLGGRRRGAALAAPGRGQAGLLGVSFPEEVGGEGGDLLDSVALQEALLRGGRLERADGRAVHRRHRAAAHRGLRQRRPGRPVRAAHARRRDDRLARRSPSPAAAPTSPASAPPPRRDGDDYVVNGAKTFITTGVRADFVTTAVRTGGQGHAGFLLVVEKGTPGFTVDRALAQDGLALLRHRRARRSSTCACRPPTWSARRTPASTRSPSSSSSSGSPSRSTPTASPPARST